MDVIVIFKPLEMTKSSVWPCLWVGPVTCCENWNDYSSSVNCFASGLLRLSVWMLKSPEIMQSNSLEILDSSSLNSSPCLSLGGWYNVINRVGDTDSKMTATYSKDEKLPKEKCYSRCKQYLILIQTLLMWPQVLSDHLFLWWPSSGKCRKMHQHSVTRFRSLTFQREKSFPSLC